MDILNEYLCKVRAADSLSVSTLAPHSSAPCAFEYAIFIGLYANKSAEVERPQFS